MRYAYPCDIVQDQEEAAATGRQAYVVSFPDVYGANTGGWSWEEALEMAEDCLAVALGMYVKAHEDIPAPSDLAEGQVLVSAPAIVAAKLALYTAMREQGLTIVGLARQLGTSEAAARRLVNVQHRSHIGLVEKALRVLGHQVVVEDTRGYAATSRNEGGGRG